MTRLVGRGGRARKADRPSGTLPVSPKREKGRSIDAMIVPHNESHTVNNNRARRWGARGQAPHGRGTPHTATRQRQMHPALPQGNAPGTPAPARLPAVAPAPKRNMPLVFRPAGRACSAAADAAVTCNKCGQTRGGSGTGRSVSCQTPAVLLCLCIMQQYYSCSPNKANITQYSAYIPSKHRHGDRTPIQYLAPMLLRLLACRRHSVKDTPQAQGRPAAAGRYSGDGGCHGQARADEEPIVPWLHHRLPLHSAAAGSTPLDCGNCLAGCSAAHSPPPRLCLRAPACRPSFGRVPAVPAPTAPLHLEAARCPQREAAAAGAARRSPPAARPALRPGLATPA